MNADRLLALYDRVAEAPDAVSRLRRFVLDLAVRGRLVEQDPADEPARDLSQRITVEKARLVRAGEIRQPKRFEVATDSSYDLPTSWRLVALGDVVVKHLGGGTPSKSNGSYWNGAVRWASVKDVGKSKYLDDTIDRITEAGLQNSSSNLIEPGNLLVVTRMGLGKVSINRVSVAINQDLRALILSDLISVDYVYNFFLTHGFEGTGLTVKGIKLKELLSIPFPLPPLAEQQRIVSKVDELMGLCDQLEVARTARERTRDRLTTASLIRLSAPDTDAATFRSHARFAVDALPALTARADQVKHLCQTILSLAVRGRLVEQDPEDEPASELLQRTEKPPLPARYAKRSPESIPGDCGLSINRPEIPSPPGWLWVPLVQVARIESGHTPSRSRADWWGGDVPWMGLVDARLHNDGRIFNTIQHTNEAGLANSAARLLPEGTVCFSRTASVGYVVIMGRPMATSQDFVNWVPTEALAPEWLQLVMMAERPAIPRFSKGAVHQTIYYPAWLAMHVALPPLAEQHRIVAEIDALMALCDHMEAGLAAADATRSRLLESLLHAALASAASRTLSMDRPFSSRHPSVRGGLSRLAHSDRIDE